MEPFCKLLVNIKALLTVSHVHALGTCSFLVHISNYYVLKFMYMHTYVHVCVGVYSTVCMYIHTPCYCTTCSNFPSIFTDYVIFNATHIVHSQVTLESMAFSVSGMLK